MLRTRPLYCNHDPLNTPCRRAPWYTIEGRPLEAYVIGIAGGSASGKVGGFLTGDDRSLRILREDPGRLTGLRSCMHSDAGRTVGYLVDMVSQPCTECVRSPFHQRNSQIPECPFSPCSLSRQLLQVFISGREQAGMHTLSHQMLYLYL